MTTKKRSQMDVTELANDRMDKAAWGDRLPKKPIQNRKHSEWAKSDAKNLAVLAEARVGTQMGGPNIRRCEAIARSTGEQCGIVAIRGENVCFHHAGAAVRARLKARRLAEGRPAETAASRSYHNVRALVRHNKLDRDLLMQPVFRSLMQLVAPNWFGKPALQLGKRVTREDVANASLLSREMVLAWEAAKGGDMNPWTQAVMKARQLGYEGAKTPFD